jgi:nucleotide-binding universal stress UspA family protein
MMSLHTLLTATNLSTQSGITAQRAAMLAQQITARLEFVHILDKRELEEQRRLLGEASEEKIRSQTRKLLEKLVDDVCEPIGLSAGRHLAEGEVLECITEQVNLLNADLLIIGARGSDLIFQQLLGATAERLLRMIPCPVLTVKQSPHKIYQNVLVPIDFSAWSSGAIRLAQLVAPQAELTLLHAYEIPFETQMYTAGKNKEEIHVYRKKVSREAGVNLHQIANDTGITGNWHPIVIHGNAVQRILEEAEKQIFDLIVLGIRSHGMTEDILLGSNARKILLQARCDVLITNH